MKRLHEQVAVVTGGGGGIGSAICRRLADAGAQIVITYNTDQGKARAVANTLSGGNHLIIRCPVGDRTAQAALAQTIGEKYGRLDILVNNAGVTKPVPHDDLDALDDDTIDHIFRVNWRGSLCVNPGAAASACRRRRWCGHQHFVYCRAHRLRQQRGLLRQQSRDGQHDPLAGARIGAANSRAVSLARLGRWRIRPAHAARAARRAGKKDAAWAHRRSGRRGGGGLCRGGPLALQHWRHHPG